MSDFWTTVTGLVALSFITVAFAGLLRSSTDRYVTIAGTAIFWLALVCVVSVVSVAMFVAADHLLRIVVAGL